MNDKTTETVKKFVPNAEEKKILALLTKEQKAVFDKTEEDEKGILLTAYETMLSASKLEASVDELSVVETREEYPILVPGKTLLPGMKLKLKFLGYVPMFSKDFKENWDKDVTPSGVTFYRSGHYRFERADGTTIGIFAMGDLHQLMKIPTNASNKKVKKNPTVEIEYIGKLTREEAEGKYNRKMTTGTHMHIFKLGLEKGIVFNKYASSYVNFLKNPTPNFDKIKLDASTVAANNWEQLQRDNEVSQIGHQETKLIG